MNRSIIFQISNILRVYEEQARKKPYSCVIDQKKNKTKIGISNHYSSGYEK